jgi:aryl-alcohol dehydrogenase-like predicted oxidoreductase
LFDARRNPRTNVQRIRAKLYGARARVTSHDDRSLATLRTTGNALEAEAKRHNVSVVQLALAWLLQKSPVILPIPGTSSLAHLEENMAATKLQLTQEDWKRIEDLARKT